MHRTLSRSLFVCSIAVGAVACVDSGADAPRTSPDELSGPIATVELADGNRVDFFEPDPGLVIVTATGALPDEDLSSVALYERLTGEAAPTALRDAEARSAAPQGEASVEELDVAVRPPARAEVSSLTAAEFTAAWCGTAGTTFAFCWPTSTNNYTYDTGNKVDWIHAHLDVYGAGDEVRMSMYKKTLTSWDLVLSQDVNAAISVHTQKRLDRDRYKLELTYATGDLYHLSIHGED